MRYPAPLGPNPLVLVLSLAASSRYAQESRRPRSGAFAAEFLLPESALGRLSEGRLDGAADNTRFSEILSEYGVGARTAAHQLYNSLAIERDNSLAIERDGSRRADRRVCCRLMPVFRL